jgi:hypothetical protein
VEQRHRKFAKGPVNTKKRSESSRNIASSDAERGTLFRVFAMIARSDAPRSVLCAFVAESSG